MRQMCGLGLAMALLLPMAARAEGRTRAEIEADLDRVERQRGTEAELQKALAAFPRLSLEEFAALPPEDLNRQRFVWAWAEHYRRARLGDEAIPSVGTEADEERRRALHAFAPTALASGMRTEGASRTTDAGLPAVLHACAEAHEAVHERDLHAQARRFARARAHALLADGSLPADPGFVAAERKLGRDAALDAVAEALFARDLAANARLVAEQRAAGATSAVRMLDGPLRDANVYYGHVNPRLPPEENFARLVRLAAYEQRAYAASSLCLEKLAVRLRAELGAADARE